MKGREGGRQWTGVRFCHEVRGRRRRTDGGCRGAERRDKPIPPPVHCGNEPRPPGVIAQGLPQFRNTVRQHAVADRHLRPHRLEQRLFRHQLAGLCDQVLQHLAGFARQGEDARALAELRIVWLECIGTKANELFFSHVLTLPRL